MFRNRIGNVMISAASVLTAGALALSMPISALAATGTITSSNVKVRSEASTSSSQVSSLDSGDKVDIVDETTDSQGYVWYRIYINDTEFGYVRSDLVSKEGATPSTDAATSTAAQPETQVTAVDAQTATITVASANVRSGAGTGYSSVGTVKNGDAVTVTGEATGTDNNKWYQIQFGTSGRTGFVRSDLLQIGAPAAADGGEAAPADGEQPAEGEAAPEGAEAAPVEGEQPAEQPAAEPAVVGNGEFSLAYKDDGTGTEVWYLYDNVEGTQVKLSDLLDYAKAGQQSKALEAQVKKLKGALIGMAIVIAILVLGVLLLIYKLRDYMYYEDEEDEGTAQKKHKYDDIPSQKPAKKFFERSETDRGSNGRTVADSKRTVSPSAPRKSAPMGSAASLLTPDRPSGRTASEVKPERPAPSRERAEQPKPGQTITPNNKGRGSRNFLLDDEDFEFEFLDLDDDDKP